MTTRTDATYTPPNEKVGPRPKMGETRFQKLAGTTRLELATSGVTGRRSNQLNYVPIKVNFKFKILYTNN